MSVANDWLSELRNLAGLLSRGIVKRVMFYRFALDDKVRFYNESKMYWDEGRISSVRTGNDYVVTDADYQQYIVPWDQIEHIEE